MSSVDLTASRLASFATDDGPGSAYLLVVDSDSSSIFQLPHAGAIVIGRGGEAELQVKHASVSRRHATIRVDDGVVRVADLESHNGTRVNGEAVAESRVLASGDVVTVGDVILVVHFSAPAAPARAAYGEAGWRRRLAEEIERAVAGRRTLGVVAVTGADPVALGRALRLIDVVGTGADGQTLLILPECDREQALQIAERALATAPEARAGLAMCPSDACDADTILLAARSAMRGARPGTVAPATEAATKIELGDRHVLIADPAMLRVFALLERLARSELPVLINGETGVGKENAAYAVHHWSRRTGPFIARSCAAIGESIADAELFGHDKGAFTGAVTAKPGLFESAAGGTLFLDEVAELPLAIQAKLLRALEVKAITRLGETRERPIDVRLVAATHRSLEAEVAAGRFREDLMYRLCGATVVLPPLRHRRTEIPLLARAFLASFAEAAGRGAMTITPAAMQALLTREWGGNVRQLRNNMQFVAATAPDNSVEPSDLPPESADPAVPPAQTVEAILLVAPGAPTTFRPLSEEVEELERRRMTEALAAAGGVKTRAAALINMAIRTFTHKLKQYGM